MKNKVFEPSQLTIPADTRVKLIVVNDEARPAEFESTEFHREKVVPAGRSVSVFVGPLSAGRYEFFDDFEPQRRGTLIVAAPADPKPSK